MGTLPFIRNHKPNSTSPTQNIFRPSQISQLLTQKNFAYLRKLGPKGRKKLQLFLQQRLNINAQQLTHFFQTPIGVALLNHLAPFVQKANQLDTTEILGEVLVQTAAHTDGLSVVNLLRQFPPQVQLDADRLLSEAQRIEQLIKDTAQAVVNIRKLAAQENAETKHQTPTDLPDIRQPGPWQVKQQRLELCDRQRLLPVPIHQQRCSRVLLYFPDPFPSDPIPVIVISHGLGSNPEDFHEYATHLSSYGYAIAIPQHPGSDAAHVQQMLTGDVHELFQLQEFIDRPQDVTFVLNVLESRNQKEFGHKLNLQNVGVVGHSFGGYTALALAGATINFQRLEQACEPTLKTLNLSLLLQCRALHLPRQNYNFYDHRVKAILPIDPVGSAVFGITGLSQITIPTLILAGSTDKLAPILLEAIRVFLELKADDSYFSLIEGKSHLGSFATPSSSTDNFIATLMPSLSGPEAALVYEYICALSIAFFRTYLSHHKAYHLYLHSHYLASISKTPLPLHFVSHASAAELKQLCLNLQASPHHHPPSNQSFNPAAIT